MDPVLMMLLVRKGNLRVEDFLAGIFSLESTGLLDCKFVVASADISKNIDGTKLIHFFWL